MDTHQLKLILIFVWMILFPIIDPLSDILTVKYKKLRGMQIQKTEEEDWINGLWLTIVMFFAGIALIHWY